MKDKLGQEINPGDYILHATRAGSNLDMSVAIVLKISDGKLLVRSSRDCWNDTIWVCRRNGLIVRMDTTVRVRPDDVPYKYRKVLDCVYGDFIRAESTGD